MLYDTDAMKDQINQIIKKLEKHDHQLETIASIVVDNQKKLEKHDKKFDSMDNRLDTMDNRLDTMDNRLDSMDNRLDTVAITVVNIQEQVNDIKETMATKSDIANISNTLDVLVGLHKKTDQELTFMGARVKRVEEKTEKNTKDIQKIKPLVGLKV